MLIRYLCYGKGHITPHCSTNLRDFSNMVTNLEALPVVDNDRVPDGTYQAVLHLVAPRYPREEKKSPLRKR